MNEPLLAKLTTMSAEVSLFQSDVSSPASVHVESCVEATPTTCSWSSVLPPRYRAIMYAATAAPRRPPRRPIGLDDI